METTLRQDEPTLTRCGELRQQHTAFNIQHSTFNIQYSPSLPLPSSHHFAGGLADSIRAAQWIRALIRLGVG